MASLVNIFTFKRRRDLFCKLMSIAKGLRVFMIIDKILLNCSSVIFLL